MAMVTSGHVSENRSAKVISSVICANCRQDVSGNYCSHCGQKTIGRFTGNYLWTSIREEAFDFDGNLWLTFRTLWAHPGNFVKAYINGATKRYYGPIKYLLFWTAIYLVVIQFTSDPSSYALQDLVFNGHEIYSNESVQDFVTLLAQLAKTQTNIYFVAILPFLAVTTFFVQRRHRYNLAEIFILLIYFYGQFAFVAIFFSIFNSIFETPTYMGLQVTDAILVFAYWFVFLKMTREFFGESWAKTTFNACVILSVGTLSFWIFLFAIFIVAKTAVA